MQDHVRAGQQVAEEKGGTQSTGLSTAQARFRLPDYEQACISAPRPQNIHCNNELAFVGSAELTFRVWARQRDESLKGRYD